MFSYLFNIPIDCQSSVPISQDDPLYSSGHAQKSPVALAMQEPPLSHDLASHDCWSASEMNSQMVHISPSHYILYDIVFMIGL